MGYSLTQSPLYRLGTKRKLAELLFTSVGCLAKISENATYREWHTKPKYPSTLPALQHKPRLIEQPTPGLSQIQRRLHDLLSRVDLPSYLYSARKGLSYVDNAKVHNHAGRAIRIDVRTFYRSASAKYIFKFFHNRLECSPDVAHLLTEIAAYGRHIPTGSPLSPIISYFAYESMFSEIAGIAHSIDAEFSIYIDDIVVSGDAVDGTLVPKCKAIIRKYELKGHKVAFFKRGQPKVITGVAMVGGRISIPHKRWNKIRALQQEYAIAKSGDTKSLYLRALVGQFREAATFDPQFIKRAHSYAAAMKYQQALSD